MKNNPIYKIVLFTILAILPYPFYGQGISRIKENPSYIWGESLAQSQEQAAEGAIKALTAKLSGIITIHPNPNINIKLYEGYGKEIEQMSLQTISKEKKSYRCLRYIHNDSINNIFRSRKSKINEMLSMAESALARLQIDIALRNLSWAETLLQSIPQPHSIGYKSRNGQIYSAQEWIKQTSEEIIRNLDARCTKSPNEGKELIAIDFTYKGKSVRSLDYRFYNGRQWSGIYSVKDGRGIVENTGSIDPKEIQIKYESYHSHLLHIDNSIKEIRQLLTSHGTAGQPAVQESEAAANIASIKRVETIDPNEVKNKILSVLAQQEQAPQQDTVNLEVSAVHNTAELEAAVEQFCSAIENGSYSLPDSLFAQDGLSIFHRLIQYGNARIIAKEDLNFYRLGNEIYCRSIPMVFSFNGNNRSFVEDIVLTFNSSNKITNITFALHKEAARDIVSHSNWPEEARIIIVTFLENYKTAYALERLDYISSIFDDQALIITGRVLKSTKIHNELMESRYVTLTKQNKEQYISRLKQVFAANEFINVSFNTSDVLMLGKGSRMYGIQLSQEYYSSNYSDKGYLFLMVDLTDHTQPVIHVRTWQTEPDKEFGIIGPYHF